MTFNPAAILHFDDIMHLFNLYYKEPKQIGTCVLTLYGQYILIKHNDINRILVYCDGEDYTTAGLLRLFLTYPEAYITGKHPAAEVLSGILPMPIHDELQECLHPYSWLPERIGDFEVTVEARHILLQNEYFSIVLCEDYCHINDQICYAIMPINVRIPYTNVYIRYQIDNFLRLFIAAVESAEKIDWHNDTEPTYFEYAGL